MIPILAIATGVLLIIIAVRTHPADVWRIVTGQVSNG